VKGWGSTSHPVTAQQSIYRALDDEAVGLDSEIYKPRNEDGRQHNRGRALNRVLKSN